VVAATEQRSVPFSSALSQHGTSVVSILAFVGPEGGWTPEELDALTAHGCQPISLGPNILRIETAAIALAAIVHVAQGAAEHKTENNPEASETPAPRTGETPVPH
jgi:RsmE family RNA methyltransferase